MPIDFPSSPTTGDVYTYLGKSWVYNGTGWDAPRALSEIGAVRTFADAAARTAAIPSPTEGIVTYLNDIDRYDTYNGSSHVPMGGLTLVKAQTIGSAVTSITVNDAFSADYDNYKILISGGVGSTTGTLRLQLGASTTGYNYIRNMYAFAGGAQTLNTVQTGTIFDFVGNSRVTGSQVNIDLLNPFIAMYTYIYASSIQTSTAGYVLGSHQVDSSFTSFTISHSLGTMTGGTINVYGYKKA
jgi:hypothetical protein